MEDNMISIAGGFQYSVNIDYDVGNAKKVASYVPTDAFVSLTSDVIDSLESLSTNRSRIVVGPYGTGKSHLITVIASVLKKSIQVENYSPLVGRLKQAGYDSFVQKFERFLHGEPYLTVLLNGNGKDLEQTFTYGLQRALLEAGVQDLMPRTSFEVANETLGLWATEYPSTLADFKSLLSETYETTYSNFYEKLMEFDHRAMSAFRAIFPKVTAGTEFNLFDTRDVPDLYREVSVLLRDKGYRGICGFDEFNKYLESSIQEGKMSDLKLLQDLAEMCNRSGEAQVHLMLISHQHMSQYATGLSDELLDTWRKVEGRFTSVRLRQSSTKTYQLIATVIEKEPVKWGSFLKSNEAEFHMQSKATRENGLFRELKEDEIERWVINGCYPLHPSTVFCLPRISNRLAQNERTLFTFLSTEDMNTLGFYLSHADDERYSLLTLDVLFDYFMDLAQKQRNQDSLGKSFLKARESISKMGASTRPVETRMLKCLAVLVGLEEPNFPPTYSNLEFCLSSGGQSDSEELANAFKNLVKKKIVYERKSDKRIQFLAGSDIDFRSAMDSVKGDSRYASRFRTSDILNEFFSPYPVIANRYNDEYEMTRFFYQEFFSVDDLDQGIDWDEYLEDKQYADGLVVYVLTETKEELTFFNDLVEKIHHPQVIFVCSSTPMNGLTDLSYDYMALDILRRDTTYWGDDPYGMAELSAYIDDYEERIERQLLQVTGYGDRSARLFYRWPNGETTFRFSGLSQLVSRICSIVFNETPRLNNELINRTNVSNTIVNARKKVMRALLSDTIETNLGLKGYGPDVSIFRSLVRRTGIYRAVNKGAECAIDEEVSPRFRRVIELIQDAFEAGSGTVSFDEVIHIVRKPPYGLRLGVLPVVLTIALREVRKSLIIRDQSGIERPLDADLVESIVKDPKSYTAEILGIDDSKQAYLAKLSELFKGEFPDGSAGSNSAYPVAVAINQWFVGLPRYARESRQYSAMAQRMRRILAMPLSDSAKFLFEDMIWAIEERNVFESDKVNHYVEAIRGIKSEMEVHLTLSRRHLEQVVASLFIDEASNLPLGVVMKSWYSALEERTRTHVFTGDCLSLLRLAGNIDIDADYYSPIDEIMWIITGLELSDWSDDTCQDFVERMTEAVATIEGFDREETLMEAQQRVTFVDGNGQVREHTFARVEVGSLGNILRSSLESALDGFADAIDMNEKRQVLLDLLLKIS